MRCKGQYVETASIEYRLNVFAGNTVNFNPLTVGAVHIRFLLAH